jgi:FkbM family methyltransferase
MEIIGVIKHLVSGTLSYLDLEVRRTRAARRTLRGSLEQVRALGLSPATVIDIGAADGTMELYETFPDAHHILVEPLVEFKPDLERLKRRFRRLDYLIAAAASRSGQTELHVHADLHGSSLHLEHEGAEVDGSPRTVPAVTVDEICAHVAAPCLLKVDVQGGELDALAGAERTLSRTDYVVLEASLFQFFREGPQFRDTMDYMHQRGFVLYDLVGHIHRPLDDALAQVDTVFLRSDSPLRRNQAFATAEQRSRMIRHAEKAPRRLAREPLSHR